MSAAVLRNKVNPNCQTHHLTISEADLILGVTGNHLMLQQLAGNHGYGLHLLSADTGGDVIQRLLQTNAASGEFAQLLQSALADGVVTQNEFLALSACSAGVQGALIVLLNRLRFMATQHPSAQGGPHA